MAQLTATKHCIRPFQNLQEKKEETHCTDNTDATFPSFV